MQVSQRANNLMAVLQTLMQSVSTLPGPRPTSGQKSSGRNKTKKGATHTVGAHFKPRFLIHMDGKPVTPAMYRRLHMGVRNPRKKWISVY